MHQSHNPLKYIDPSGHCAYDDRACWDVVRDLWETYGWIIEGIWTLAQVQNIQTAARAIGDWFMDAGGTIEDMRAAIGEVTFAHAALVPELLDTNYAILDTIYLAFGFDPAEVLHEIGHVMDNNLSWNPLASIVFGGGPADDMGNALGGLAWACGAKFICWGYKTYGEELGLRAYGLRGPSEDFADTFSWAVTNSARLGLYPQRAEWMRNFVALLVAPTSHAPTEAPTPPTPIPAMTGTPRPSVRGTPTPPR